MTDSEKGAVKDYLELRIKCFRDANAGLKRLGDQELVRTTMEAITISVRNNNRIIHELEGVARHLKIQLDDIHPWGSTEPKEQ